MSEIKEKNIQDSILTEGTLVMGHVNGNGSCVSTALDNNKKGSIAMGTINAVDSHISTGYPGSIAFGSIDSPNSYINANDNATIAGGVIEGTDGDSKIYSDNIATITYGYINGYNSAIKADEHAAIAHGHIQGDDSIIQANGTSSISRGSIVGNNSSIFAGSEASIARGRINGNNSEIKTDGTASIAHGLIEGDNSTIFTDGNGGLVYGYIKGNNSSINTEQCSLAFGYVDGEQGKIQTWWERGQSESCKGAIAGGYALDHHSIKSTGDGAFAVGYAGVAGDLEAKGVGAHAEGESTHATNKAAHAEGLGTEASGGYSHSEGCKTIANNDGSHAEGGHTIASGKFSHAEGYNQGLEITLQIEAKMMCTGRDSDLIIYKYDSILDHYNLDTILIGAKFYIESVNIDDDIRDTLPPDEDQHEFKIKSYDIDSSSTEQHHIRLCNIMVSYIDIDGNEKSDDLKNINDNRYDETYLFTHTIIYNDNAEGFASHTEGYSTYALEIGAHAEGLETIADGQSSHTEGSFTRTDAHAAHAEGYKTEVTGDYSHAEGYHTEASGRYSHTEGKKTIVKGYSSHAEGGYTKTEGDYSHAEGRNTKVYNNYSHAEGYATEVQGRYSHAEGYTSIVYGNYSHAEGSETQVRGRYSHAEGFNTEANGIVSHAEGRKTYAIGARSHAEGHYASASGNNSHAEGYYTEASGRYSHAEGCSTKAYGRFSHTEGANINAISESNEGFYEIQFEKLTTADQNNINKAIGKLYEYKIKNKNVIPLNYTQTIPIYNDTRLDGDYFEFDIIDYVYLSDGNIVFNVNAEVDTTTSSEKTYYAYIYKLEYNYTIAVGSAAHAEGICTKAYGIGSHTQCIETVAQGMGASAEGYRTQAIGLYSHAEGYNTQALGEASHAMGTSDYVQYEFKYEANKWHELSLRYKTDPYYINTLESETVPSYGSIENVMIDKLYHNSINVPVLISIDNEIYYCRSITTNPNSNKVKITLTPLYAYNNQPPQINEYKSAKVYFGGEIAYGDNSFVGGRNSIVYGNNSFAYGRNLIVRNDNEFVIGEYNDYTGRNTDDPTLFSIGNGEVVQYPSQMDPGRSNIFRVTKSGIFGNAPYTATGADYAEYFEWEDGNVNNENRLGHFVTIDNGKIKISKNDDEPIGIVSGASSIIGNAAEEEWNKKYLKDIYGQYIYDVNSSTGEKIRKINPLYKNEEYIPRSKRKEWAIIGLLGQLIVDDDGTCEVGKKCSPNKDGIATAGNKYFVLERLDESHIKILFK